MTGDRGRLGMLGALLLATVWQSQTHAAVRHAAARHAAATGAGTQLHNGQADLRLPGGTMSLRLVGDNVLHIHFIPTTGASPSTLVMAPDATGPSGTTVA